MYHVASLPTIRYDLFWMNAKNDSGPTPLNSAVLWKQTEIADYLKKSDYFDITVSLPSA